MAQNFKVCTWFCVMNMCVIDGLDEHKASRISRGIFFSHCDLYLFKAKLLLWIFENIHGIFSSALDLKNVHN